LQVQTRLIGNFDMLNDGPNIKTNKILIL